MVALPGDGPGRPGEDVARAAHRQDAARLLGIVLDGGADADDMDVDRAVEGLELLALQQVHQRIARQHAAGALGQRQQQGELVGGEWPLLAVDPHDARALVDLEPPEAQHLGLRRRRPCGAGWRAGGPAARAARRAWRDSRRRRPRARPRGPSARRARSASGSARRSCRAGGGRDRGRRRRAASGRGSPRRRLSRFSSASPSRAGAGDGQTKARPAEIVGDHPGEAVIVVDHQDALGHAPSIRPGRPRCHSPRLSRGACRDARARSSS